MAKVIVDDSYLSAMGTAIRAKTGGTSLLAPSGMAAAINSIVVSQASSYQDGDNLNFTDTSATQKYLITSGLLAGIDSAIMGKTGSQAHYTPAQMATAISGISAGGVSSYTGIIHMSQYNGNGDFVSGIPFEPKIAFVFPETGTDIFNTTPLSTVHPFILAMFRGYGDSKTYTALYSYADGSFSFVDDSSNENPYLAFLYDASTNNYWVSVGRRSHYLMPDIDYNVTVFGW